MRHIPAIHLRMEAQKRHFCRYMAKIRAIFRSKSAHGTKFPWDGSADPWDGNRNPWDGIDERPPSRRLSNAKRRTNTRVRFNGLPYSAHGSGAFSQAFAGASNRKGGSLRRGGIPAARKRSGRQPRHDIFSSRWAVRDVRDAMNRVSPARGVSPVSAFLPRGGPCGTWRAVCRVIAW